MRIRHEILDQATSELKINRLVVDRLDYFGCVSVCRARARQSSSDAVSRADVIDKLRGGRRGPLIEAAWYLIGEKYVAAFNERQKWLIVAIALLRPWFRREQKILLPRSEGRYNRKLNRSPRCVEICTAVRCIGPHQRSIERSGAKN